MFKKHLGRRILSGVLVCALAFSTGIVPAPEAEAADTPSFDYEVTGNPIGTLDPDGNPLYGGDPSVLVDGDTVYLYVGHDVAPTEAYNIPEYACYSTKDLKKWTYHGIVLKMTDVKWGAKDAAWAGQVMKHDNKYYMYYCSWDSTDGGKQSIGVAVADAPTGPFVDKGEPIVKGSVTTGQTSNWNDIDPTAWIETDADGVEHRYLSWGNGKVFVCELNEDMVSVKDINGDGAITFGTQASGKTSKDADIIEKDVTGLTYTEAPWIYRRKGADGNLTGPYYLFYAYGWREQMAYATTDNLMDGKLAFGKILMPPTATSNTNHMAVFDFNGKTYFIYHDGTLPGGSGFRRTPCIAEMQFHEDGSIEAIPESAAGLWGTTNKIYTSDQKAIAHENFTNSGADGDYPYTNVGVGTLEVKDELDSEWVFSKSYYDTENGEYVSIQSENKPGLYLTAKDDNRIVLAQNAVLASWKETAKKQTFKKVAGLNDADGVSYESVAKPGFYITVMAGNLYLTDGSRKAASTFYLDTPPAEIKTDGGDYSSDSSLADLKASTGTVTKGDKNDYTVTVPATETTVNLTLTLSDKAGLINIDGGMYNSGDAIPFSTGTTTAVKVYAPDWTTVTEYTVTVKKDYNSFQFGKGPVFAFDFENTTDNAVAVTKGLPPAPVSNPSYAYVDGVNGGKAISLTGAYGLQLCDTAKLGDDYTISFWMKPTTLGGGVDPIFAAGTFKPEYWMNVTCADRGIWCNNGGYVDIDNTPTVKYETGKWQHVVVTVKTDSASATGATGNLYLNGQLISYGKVANMIMTQSGAKAYFGVNGWDAYFNGAADEIMLFDRVLSETEIGALNDGITKLADIKGKTDDPVVNPPSDDNNNKTKKTVKKVVITKKGSSKAIKKTLKLKKGKKLKLAAKVTVTGGASKKVTWKSSKKKVAKVTSAGVVTAKKKGTVKITATSKANKKKKCTITIKVVK